ncbi:type II secretion system protein GspG [Puia dinghuensis]|uniref:Type II secretion system protein GspG C-terminal domain-containing protein n=1 Tax=Puia dinghuensis TaxID=1792502 RepID=A0A8J2XR67_9BACT|nr:type II secretion system protein GspG [Puia dinghuensis]GGA87912.1 hypothetical protein GCM10011511_08790 [Puia dinghuensis]
MEKNSKPPYLIGLLCLIPLVGALVGVALILYGVLKYKDKWLIAIGAFGVVFTIGVYSFLAYDLKYGKDAGEAFARIAQKQINNLANELESYKARNGKYPDDLDQLSHWNSDIIIADPLLVRKEFKNPKPYFHYVNKGDNYILFSVGIDGFPNTKDDIYPNLPTGHYGYIKP